MLVPSPHSSGLLLAVFIVEGVIFCSGRWTMDLTSAAWINNCYTLIWVRCNYLCMQLMTGFWASVCLHLLGFHVCINSQMHLLHTRETKHYLWYCRSLCEQDFFFLHPMFLLTTNLVQSTAVITRVVTSKHYIQFKLAYAIN